MSSRRKAIGYPDVRKLYSILEHLRSGYRLLRHLSIHECHFEYLDLLKLLDRVILYLVDSIEEVESHTVYDYSLEIGGCDEAGIEW